jgi:hypothetical protein
MHSADLMERNGVIVLEPRMTLIDRWAFRVAPLGEPRTADTPVVVLAGADDHRLRGLDAIAVSGSR